MEAIKSLGEKKGSLSKPIKDHIVEIYKDLVDEKKLPTTYQIKKGVYCSECDFKTALKSAIEHTLTKYCMSSNTLNLNEFLPGALFYGPQQLMLYCIFKKEFSEIWSLCCFVWPNFFRKKNYQKLDIVVLKSQFSIKCLLEKGPFFMRHFCASKLIKI